MLTMTHEDIRNAVLAELKRRKWSNYKLVQELKDRDVPEASVYRYLAGTSDITTKVLAEILDVLGLVISRSS